MVMKITPKTDPFQPQPVPEGRSLWRGIFFRKLPFDAFPPNTGEVRSDGAKSVACWFLDTDYNEESFFVRHAYFLGASDPYKSLTTSHKTQINKDAWESLPSDTSRPFDKPSSGCIAVKVINHLGDEVMKEFRVQGLAFRLETAACVSER